MSKLSIALKVLSGGLAFSALVANLAMTLVYAVDLKRLLRPSDVISLTCLLHSKQVYLRALSNLSLCLSKLQCLIVTNDNLHPLDALTTRQLAKFPEASIRRLEKKID